MYESLLFIHSWLRWIVLILMLVTIFKAIMGVANKSSFTGSDGTLLAGVSWSVRIQFILGVILYLFLSPIVQTAFNDFGAAMKNSGVRYWAVEHTFAMFVSIALIEIGTSKAKKATEDMKKFKFQAIFYGIALLIMLSRIPFGESERLFR